MTDDQAERLERKLDKIIQILPTIEALGELVVIQQKDAAAVSGLTDDTIRNRAKRGDISVLSKEDSRLNYLTLATVRKLKKKR
jgi:hypothetical protein